MDEIAIKLEPRSETGKGPNRRIRMTGKIPACLYGLGKNANVIADPLALTRLLLQEGGRNRILTLQGAGLEGKHALVKDYAVDPLSRKLLHVDLLEIDTKKKISVTVAINFTGKAAGVAEGGVLNIVEREIEVRCLPNKIPQHIDVDVTALTIGDSIHLDQVALPEGIEKVSQANPTLVTVVPPTKEEEAVASLTQAAAPEVITEKKPAEGEGAAPAAGGDAKEKEKK